MQESKPIFTLTEADFFERIEALLTKHTNKTPETPDDLLTRSATAEYLGVSLPTLYSYSKCGQLKPIRYGNRVYYRKSDLLKKDV